MGGCRFVAVSATRAAYAAALSAGLRPHRRMPSYCLCNASLAFLFVPRQPNGFANQRNGAGPGGSLAPCLSLAFSTSAGSPVPSGSTSPSDGGGSRRVPRPSPVARPWRHRLIGITRIGTRHLNGFANQCNGAGPGGSLAPCLCSARAELPRRPRPTAGLRLRARGGRWVLRALRRSSSPPPSAAAARW